MSIRQFLYLLVAGLFSPWALLGQDSPSLPVQQITEKFAANEQELQRVRSNYSFRQEVRIQELDLSDAVVGEFRAVFEMAQEGTGTGKRPKRFWTRRVP